MRRSELEIHIDILRVLAKGGPLKITHIMHKANICYDILKECLRFLMQHNLVETRNSGTKKVVYVITQRGILVLKQFRELRNTLPLYEQDRRVPPMLS